MFGVSAGLGESFGFSFFFYDLRSGKVKRTFSNSVRAVSLRSLLIPDTISSGVKDTPELFFSSRLRRVIDPGAKVEALDNEVYAMAARGLLNANLERLVERLQERVKEYKEKAALEGQEPGQEVNSRVPVPIRKKGRRVIHPGVSRGWVE